MEEQPCSWAGCKDKQQEGWKKCYRWHPTCTHLVTTGTLYKVKKYVVPLSGPQFLLLMCRLFVPIYWHTAEFFAKTQLLYWQPKWCPITVRCHQLHLRDWECFWPHSQHGHWARNTLKWVFNFHPLLYKISFTQEKPRHCFTSPFLSWQGHIFPENCMKQLKGLCFQLGSDFVLRHGFSLTEEMNEADRSQSIYSPKTPLLILRCLVLKVRCPVTLS